MPITKPDFRKQPAKKRRRIARKQRNLSVTAEKMGELIFSTLHNAVRQILSCPTETLNSLQDKESYTRTGVTG